MMKTETLSEMTSDEIKPSPDLIDDALEYILNEDDYATGRISEREKHEKWDYHMHNMAQRHGSAGALYDYLEQNNMQQPIVEHGRYDARLFQGISDVSRLMNVTNITIDDGVIIFKRPYTEKEFNEVEDGYLKWGISPGDANGMTHNWFTTMFVVNKNHHLLKRGLDKHVNAIYPQNLREVVKYWQRFKT